METHVEFLDNLEQTKIIELLNKAKLLIHSSRFETFGLVAIEANTMGVPVLTINNGSLMEVIENNKNGNDKFIFRITISFNWPKNKIKTINDIATELLKFVRIFLILR